MTIPSSEPVTVCTESPSGLFVRVDPLLQLPLSQLLQLTQSLRNRHCYPQSSRGKQQQLNNMKDDNVPLRSLVSIHNSVIRAALECSSVAEIDFKQPETQNSLFTVGSDSLKTDFPAIWTLLLRTEEDKRIARRLWFTTPMDPIDMPYDLDAQRLLMIQYGVTCIHPVIVASKDDMIVNPDNPSGLSHSLSLLRILILPLCLAQDTSVLPSSCEEDEWNKANATFYSASSVTDDLLNAMLDAVLPTTETNQFQAFFHDMVEIHEICLQQKWLVSCLDLVMASVRLHYSYEKRRIKENSIREEHCWKSSCRIVRRLAAALKPSSNTDVLGSVGTLCIIAVDFVASFGRGSHNESDPRRIQVSFSEYESEPSLFLSRLLRPMVMDLLPVLTDALDNDVSSIQYTAALSEVRRLWAVLWNYYIDDASRHRQSCDINVICGSYLQHPWCSSTSPISSVTTSILCVLLPSLVHTALPVSIPAFALETYLENQSTSTNSVCIPIFHQNLWGMILRCLGLGLSYHVDHRGRRRTAIPGTSSSVAFSPEIIRMHQLHRRRGLFLLRLLVENFDPHKDSILPSECNGKAHMQNPKSEVVLWQKYVACFETLEMESDQHLIDQVWETVSELFDQMVPSNNQNSPQSNATPVFSEIDKLSLPLLTWDWMQLMLGRILVSHESPVLRKLSLFRLFKGQAGIRCSEIADFTLNDMTATERELTSATAKSKSQRKAKSKPRGASLHVIPVDFLFTVILYSFDTLLSSVGTNMQATAAVLSYAGTSGSKSQAAVSEEMTPLLCRFLSQYLRLLLIALDKASLDDRSVWSEKLEQFFRRLWSPDVLDGVHHKITVSIFESVSSSLQVCYGDSRQHVPIRDDMLRLVSESFQLAFSDGSMVTAYKESLLRSLAIMLRYSKVVGNHNPQSILSVLALYPSRMLDETVGVGDIARSTSLENYTPPNVVGNPMVTSLSTWLIEEVSVSFKIGINVGAIVATAFVDGMMSAPQINESMWDPKASCTNGERNCAKAIALLCILPNSMESPSTAGELLWPAIYKGVSHSAAVIVGNNLSKADHVSRALLLLEYGVRLCALSGLGNGDLVVDQKTLNMLPPLQKVDYLLGGCVNFILFHVKCLFTTKNGISAVDNVVEKSGNASRSSDARVLSMTFARLVSQLQYLVNGFPSSLTIGPILTSALEESVDVLCQAECSSDCDCICLHMALVYVTLASGCEMNSGINHSTARTFLHLQFDNGRTTAGTVQALRSAFQFAKWGAISKMVPLILTSKYIESSCDGINIFIDDLIGSAVDAIEASPAAALVPLFESIIAVANFRFVESTVNQMENFSANLVHFSKVTLTLLDLVDGCDSSHDSIYMIDKICALLFQSTLLLQEYRILQESPSYEAPILESFRRLVRMSGTERPHISRIVVSRACTSWLKCSEVGVPAIPYRDDIVQLLVHKEDIVPITSSFSSDAKAFYEDRISLVPNTDETCISRGFLLVFLSKLPDIDNRLSSTVLKDLLHFIVLKLVRLVALAPTSSSGLIMHGVRASPCRRCFYVFI
jgi:hypothetical protein